MTLATHMAGSPYAGWWIGLFVGFGVVVVVVALVAMLLAAASRIGDGARAAADALGVVRTRLGPVGGLERANRAMEAVLQETRAARSETPR